MLINFLFVWLFVCGCCCCFNSALIFVVVVVVVFVVVVVVFPQCPDGEMAHRNRPKQVACGTSP